MSGDGAADGVATKTILVAEDDEILKRLIARFLDSRSGVITLLARDGAEALHILEHYPDAIDLDAGAGPTHVRENGGDRLLQVFEGHIDVDVVVGDL